MAEKQIFLDAGGWDLINYPHTMTPEEIAIDEGACTFEFDIRGKKITHSLLGQDDELDLSHIHTEWTDTSMVRWLDKTVRQARAKNFSVHVLSQP